jgi:transporter family-2 protein
MNGGLAALWGSPQQAALYSFGSGFVILCIIAIASPAVRGGLAQGWQALRSGSLRWWEAIGGFLGAIFVLTQSGVVPIIGVAAFTVGIVAGQTSNSLIVDRLGVSPRGRIPVSWQRVVAALVALVAVVLAVSGRLGQDDPGVLPIAASFLAGVLIAFQQAINGRVMVESGRALSATWLNFALGTLLLATVFGIGVLMGQPVASVTGDNALLYFGGFIGLIFIALAAWSVTRVGVLVTSLLTIAGQLTAAVVLDLALPTAGGVVTVGLVAGVVLTFIAVLIATLGRSRA